MSYTLTNRTLFQIALDSIGVVLAKSGVAAAVKAGVAKLTSEVVAAAQKGYLLIVPSTPAHILTADTAGQTVFQLPVAWPSEAPTAAIIKSDGTVLKPTIDYVIDAEAGTLTYQHDDLAENATLWIEGLPEGISAGRLSETLQAALPRIAWGAETIVNPTTQKSLLQVNDADGTVLKEAIVLRLTSAQGVALSIAGGGSGTLLCGTGNDIIVRTSAVGKATVQAVYSGTGLITVAAGVTQGSKPVDCSPTKDLTFGSQA